MIRNLTDDQRAQIPVYRERWLEIGLKTGPTHREAATQAVQKMYEVAGLAMPEVVFCKSPIGCLDAWAKITGKPKDRKAQLANFGFGNHDASWLGFYSFFREQTNIESLDIIQGLVEMAMSAGWYLPYDTHCFVSDRPEGILRDDRGRLHCETGPALWFSDGLELYAVHGVRCKKRMVMDPASYTKEEILALGNSELARVLAERMGWDKFLDKIGAKVINTWKDPRTGLDYELLKLAEEFGETQPKLLRMRSPFLKDGTDPWYVEPVDHRLRTAQAARKWQLVDWPDENDKAGLVEACEKDPEYIFDEEA